MKGIKYFFILIIFSLIFCSGYLSAEEGKDYQVYSLGEIVVRGQNSAVRDIGITSEVTYEDIQATDSKTVAEALDYVPGV